MPKDFQDPQQYFQGLNQVFHWILAGPLAYFAYLFLTKEPNGGWEGLIHEIRYVNVLLYTLLPLCIGVAGYAYKNFRDHNRSISSAISLKEKLQAYREHFTRMQILMGGAGTVSLIGLHVTGKEIFLGFYMALLFASSIHRPTPHTVSKALRLSEQHRTVLLKGESFPDEN